MRNSLMLWLAFTLLRPAGAAVVRVIVTGSLERLHVSEGPVFGYRSRQPIPPGLPFTLVCTFDDERGVTKMQTNELGELTGSGQQGVGDNSPGTGAVLSIGSSNWDFGESTRSEISVNASPDLRHYTVRFMTADRDNWISVVARPRRASPWTASGDWRESFDLAGLEPDPIAFSVDNGTVAAEGVLRPDHFAVEGTALHGQALLSTSTSSAEGRQLEQSVWRLAHPSPSGGYVVEQVRRTIVGTMAPDSRPIIPMSKTCWLAWRVAPGTSNTTAAADPSLDTYPPGSRGDVTLSGVARFYEGLAVPAQFLTGSSADHGDRLLSCSDPRLLTSDATLPVSIAAHFNF